MKTHNILFGFATLALVCGGCASRKPPPEARLVPGPMGERKVYNYSQQVWNSPTPVLFTPEQAQAIVDSFRTGYPGLGSPRMLIYVNRELIDEQSGMKVSARSETVETTRTSVDGGATTNTTKNTARNTYSNNGNKPAPTLVDRQTVRDVERLMGRPLRAAGATLVDERVASEMIGDRPLDSINTENEQAHKDREAVSKVADAVVEVLISSRSVTVTELNGDKNYSVPDIQATVIRLKDAKVVGQASAGEVMNRAGGASAAARNFTVQDITEATSLALMQDMVAK